MSREQSGKSLVLSVSPSPAGQSLSGPGEAVSEAKRPSAGSSRTEEAGWDQVAEPPNTGLGKETHAPAGNGHQKGAQPKMKGMTGVENLFLDGLMKQLESVHKEQGEMDSEDGDGDCE
ncbi:unnamed protein product [Parascedosporium putredinis]|uniref:Uncharacterized protein n=1 Tax=Parascedosporium putredinis TaxID=1442378 RepID=A0A9P1MEG7_9PEZI|nr:unnamed protein product [Parascedosporium putredinis]CAI8001469.1 unnamed protein product [Parascedosporium putredinis]